MAENRCRWAPWIPDTWDVAELKWVARIFAGGTPDRSNPDFWTDGTVPWLNSGAVNAVTITEPSALVTELAAQRGATRWAPKGSVVVALAGQGKTKGMAARLEIASTLNQSLAAIVPGPRLNHRFLHYWLTSNYLNLRGLAGGDLRDGLNLQHIGGVQVPLPPAVRQQAIADYLDRETAQIDAFIAKNQELIALLAERRAAVIREGTGVGLDANAELIDSGLDDVGMIPAGWRVMRLSWLFRSTGSGTTPPSELMLDGEEADVWWVTTGELRERIIESTNRGVSADTLAATSALKIHPAGSLLIAMYGATIGRMGVLGVPAASNQAVCALSGPVDCSVEFVEYAMLAARERLLLEAVGGGQPNINQETVRAFRIPVPPLVEQQRIVAHLRERVGEVDRAIGIAERGIELARERRSALISAAVTGKIEVGPA